MGLGTVGEVWDGSGDPRGGLERVGGPSQRFGVGSWDPRGGPGRVGGPSRWA